MDSAMAGSSFENDAAAAERGFKNSEKEFLSRRQSAEKAPGETPAEGSLKISGSEHQVLEKSEGGSKEGTGRAHAHTYSLLSSKAAECETLTLSTQLSKGAGSERENSGRENGLKLQGRDHVSCIKSDREIQTHPKRDSAQISVSEGEANHSDKKIRLAGSSIVSEAEMPRKSEGSCLPEDAEAEAKVADGCDTSHSSTTEKSEMEVEELDPQEEDHGCRIVAEKVFEGYEAKEEIQIEEIAGFEETSSPKVVTVDAEASKIYSIGIPAAWKIEDGEEKDYTSEFGDYFADTENTHLHKKLKLEAPLLLLSLPDTSLSLGSPCVSQGPRSSSKAKIKQSISVSEAHSNGVTTSLSLSCSQSFMHNPSCSFTLTSLDNPEFSTVNDQLSYGNGQISDDGDEGRIQKSNADCFERRKLHKELPLYQHLRQSGNLQASLGAERRKQTPETDSRGSKRCCASEKAEGSAGSHGNRQLPLSIQQHKSNLEGRLLEARGDPLDRQRSFQKYLLERPDCGWSSPLQKVGSWERWPELQTSGKGRWEADRGVSKLDSECSGRARIFEINEDRSSIHGEKVSLIEIVTQPILAVARKLSELPETDVDHLKESLKDMLEIFEKREELTQLQRILQKRTDLSSETLLQAHRAQLELLLAMKTGILGFLQSDDSLTTSAMVEIFSHTKCRNIRCQSQLPADDCDCPICSQKNGFCSACMCVVCSKFDFDANTCRWVGCDFCMHWCHTDCGLQASYILPGQSIRGASGMSEMQFRCVACGQKSELFGFVKDVFTTCAQDWGRDVLAKELECARRMFCKSEDKRGKQLCKRAEVVLSRLQSGEDTAEACQSMLSFFTNGEMETENLQAPRKNSAVSILQEAQKQRDSIQESLCITSVSEMDQPTNFEKLHLVLQKYSQLEDKKIEAGELWYDKARKNAEIEDLECLVRIKHAESQMFQARADEARREAESLRRIVLAKCDKIQDEHTRKIIKLRLNETEEKRRKQMEELKMSERSALEFNNMKIKVIADIQELLAKMEATKRRFFS